MDTITILDDNNNEKMMEVCLTFKLAGYNDNYIIYNELDKSHYYIGKYKDDSLDIDTRLNEEEYKLCNQIFEKVVGNHVGNK